MPWKKGAIRVALTIGLFVGTICRGAPAAAGDVEVRAEGMRSGAGDLLVAICSERTFLRRGCERGARGPADASAVTVPDVPPGRYAVQAYHDENGNGQLDRDRFGRPLEGLGFSRNAQMRFGPPRFADAAVQVPSRGGVISLKMRYFK